MKEEKGFSLIFLATSIIWIQSSVEKFMQGKFVLSMPSILHIFVSHNPYGFYKEFLLFFAIPHATVFGQLVLWGELLTALSMAAGSLLLFIKGKNRLYLLLLLGGLIGGMFLNANFYFASGWMSPSTNGINLLMFLIELIGTIYIISNFNKNKV